jgi:hypothetical protein
MIDGAGLSIGIVAADRAEMVGHSKVGCVSADSFKTNTTATARRS